MILYIISHFLRFFYIIPEKLSKKRKFTKKFLKLLQSFDLCDIMKIENTKEENNEQNSTVKRTGIYI